MQASEQRPLIECQFSADGEKVTKCYGHYCSIKTYHYLEVSTIEKQCVLITGDYQLLPGCFETKRGFYITIESTLNECICQTANCNADVASAVESIESMPMPTLPAKPTTTTVTHTTTTLVTQKTTTHRKTTSAHGSTTTIEASKTTTTVAQGTTTQRQTTTNMGMKKMANGFGALACLLA